MARPREVYSLHLGLLVPVSDISPKLAYVSPLLSLIKSIQASRLIS